jgi:hypothetical protein
MLGIGKLLALAAVIEAVGLLANSATSIVSKESSGALRWIVPPAIAVVAAMVKVLIDWWFKRTPPDKVAPPPRHVPPSGQIPPPIQRTDPARRARWALLAIVVVLVFCGGGGFAITTGVRQAVGWFTGFQPGAVDQLVQPVSARAGRLSLTVRRVVVSRNFTRVEVEARNAGNASLSLPTGGFCVFVGGDGTTLQADPFRGDWSETVPPGSIQRGTIIFGGRLPDGVNRAALSFSQIFGPGGGAITVRGIQLRA